MKPKVTDKGISNSSSVLIQLVRKSIVIYFLSAVAVPAICFIFGWRSLENVGTGFLYGSLGLALFGALILAGNTVPSQLSRLSIPKYIVPSLSRDQKTESKGSPFRDDGIRFFFTTLICGAALFVTGLLIKILR